MRNRGTPIPRNILFLPDACPTQLLLTRNSNHCMPHPVATDSQHFHLLEASVCVSPFQIRSIVLSVSNHANRVGSCELRCSLPLLQMQRRINNVHSMQNEQWHLRHNRHRSSPTVERKRKLMAMYSCSCCLHDGNAFYCLSGAQVPEQTYIRRTTLYLRCSQLLCLLCCCRYLYIPYYL